MFYFKVVIISIWLVFCLLIPSWSAPNQPIVYVPSKQYLNPDLKYPDLESFRQAIGRPAILLRSTHVYFFAPKFYEWQAKAIFPYLTKAYDALYKIVGVDTKYIIVVYNFPKGHPDITGGTSECVIRYDNSNLQLDQHEEWKRYRKPHVSGYIEEMAHNFVDATKAQFGWEMVGWSIGIKVSSAVAGNAYFFDQVRQTRMEQEKTFIRYRGLGYIFPRDIPANLVDRIHAYLLMQSELKYGPTFWQDFFTEIRKRKQELDDAVKLSNGDAIRNQRYRITLDCFDRLPGLKFKQFLAQNGISLTTDIKSLHPTEPGWNRQLH